MSIWDLIKDAGFDAAKLVYDVLEWGDEGRSRDDTRTWRDIRAGVPRPEESLPQQQPVTPMPNQSVAPPMPPAEQPPEYGTVVASPNITDPYAAAVRHRHPMTGATSAVTLDVYNPGGEP